jgi:hypothetical protein
LKALGACVSSEIFWALSSLLVSLCHKKKDEKSLLLLAFNNSSITIFGTNIDLLQFWKENRK